MRTVASGLLVCQLAVPVVLSADKWTRVQIPDPAIALVIRRTLDEASRRLADPGCQAILTDFHDVDARPLAARLATLGMDIGSYLRVVLFRDGSAYEACVGTLAYTHPSSRVVYICSRAVAWHWSSNRDHLVVMIIHEVLHTLGLGENPPSSSTIDRRVRQRCL